jgi:hypothetical protein
MNVTFLPLQVLPNTWAERLGDLVWLIVVLPIGMTLFAVRTGQYFGRLAALALLIAGGTVLFPTDEGSRWWFVEMSCLGVCSSAATTALLRNWLLVFGAKAPIVFAIIDYVAIAATLKKGGQGSLELHSARIHVSWTGGSEEQPLIGVERLKTTRRKPRCVVFGEFDTRRPAFAACSGRGSDILRSCRSAEGCAL